MTPIPPCVRISHMSDLSFLFEPRSVAVIGASSVPYSLTNVNFLHPLLQYGFKGNIYPVNPNLTEVLGLRAYPSILDVPEQVDYAVCAIPIGATPGLIHDCVKARVKAVSLFTAGFTETGEETGSALEKEIVQIARRGGVRIIGPNCLGIHSPKAGLSLDGTIPKKSGHVSFMSQSGGNAQDSILSLADRGIYLGKLISFGNAADLNETDFLEYFAGDDESRIIGAYMEGIREPARFLKVARETCRKKPVIVVKGGQTSAGAGAVTLHTGALAGNRTTWEALCRQTGIIQVGDLKEMVDTMQAFTYLKLPRGRRVGILGVGGGANVLAADECEAAGLTVPVMPEEVARKLREFTPVAGTGVRNPVDTLTDIYCDPPILAQTFRIMAEWDGVDMLMMVFPTLLGVRLGDQILKDGMNAVIAEARNIDKPVAFILRTANFAAGENLGWEVMGLSVEAGFPIYWSYRDAARAIDRLIRFGEKRRAISPPFTEQT